MDRPRPWLRYVNADDLDDTSVKFASMKVEHAQGDKLGSVDGSIIDVPWSEWQPHYEQPDWWQSNYYRPERAGSAGVTAGAEMPSKRETSQREGEPELARDSAKRRGDRS